MYVVTGDDLHCPLHDQTFARTGACAGCVSDPGQRIDDEPEAPIATPKGCLSTVDVERQYVQVAADLQSMIHSITRGKQGKGKGSVPEAPLDLHAYNTIAKLTDCRIKALRQVHDCAAQRETEAIVTRREREKRALERSH